LSGFGAGSDGLCRTGTNANTDPNTDSDTDSNANADTNTNATARREGIRVAATALQGPWRL